MAANYYSLIFRAVSKLPSNTAKARREVYERARNALAAQTDSKSDSNALERAIRAVERSPNEIPGTRGPTWLLMLSILALAKLWMLDATSMSAYWVVRPWNGDFSLSENDPLKTGLKNMDPKQSERFPGTNLDARRLTLSLSIVGAILAPLSTGSLGRFIRHPYTPGGVYYEETAPPPMTREQRICDDRFEDWSATKSFPLLYPELKALPCDKLLEQLRPKKIAHPFPANFKPTAFLARDIAIGSILPALFILVVPRIGRRYWRWLTS